MAYRREKEDRHDIVLDFGEEGDPKPRIDPRTLKWDPVKPLRLRLERHGQRLKAAFSQGTWEEIYPLNIWRWPAKLRVGVVALNTASEPFAAHFSDYKLASMPASAPAPAQFISRPPGERAFAELNPENTLPGGWGNRMDPEGIGDFRVKNKQLTIEMPGLPADCSSVTHLYNAPRALTEIEGDFSVRVLVQPPPFPTGSALLQNVGLVNAAGLIAMADDLTFLRFDALQWDDHGRKGNGLSYEYHRGDRRELNEPGLAWDFEKPIWIRLERRGAILRGMHSENGQDWIFHPPIDITSWPAKVRVGVNVCQTSSAPFTAQFSEYTIATTLLPRAADVPLAPLVIAPGGELPGWGVEVDPDSAATFTLDGKDLTIALNTVPSRLYRIAANAPRALTKVEGDFTAQVRVDTPIPRDEAPDLRCGGLVVMANDRTFVRLYRGVRKEKGKRGTDEVDFRFFLQGLEVSGQNSDEFEWNDRVPTWLRVKRQGNHLMAAISEDAQQWTELKPLDISDLPGQLYVGVFAANATGRPVTFVMHDFKLSKGN